MTRTTTTPVPVRYTPEQQRSGIEQFLAGAELTDRARRIAAEELFDELCAQVDARIFEGFVYTRDSGEFIHPAGAELPTEEQIDELFENVWLALDEKVPAIVEKAEEIDRLVEAMDTADAKRRLHTFDANLAAAERAVAAKLAVELAGGRDGGRETVANILNVSGPAVSKLTAKVADVSTNWADFELLEVGEIGDEYDGWMHLYNQGKFLLAVPDVQAGRRAVAVYSGVTVSGGGLPVATLNTENIEMQKWTFR